MFNFRVTFKFPMLIYIFFPHSHEQTVIYNKQLITSITITRILFAQT